MMGRGIAACIMAGGNHEVRLYGRRPDALVDAEKKISELVGFLQDNDAASDTHGGLTVTTSLEEAVAGADFVFESIVEDLEAKKKLFKTLEELTQGTTTVLCTNTSSLSVTSIMEGCKSDGAGRALAAHFIGPAHLVPLVELCPGLRTHAKDSAEGPLARVRDFLVSIGKRPVVLKKEIDGFIAARLQAALYRECLHLQQSGVADCEAIDSAVFNGFGRRLNQIGPFQQADFAGVDLVQKTHAKLFPQLGTYQVDSRAEQLVSEGRCGVKAQAGHYDWTEEQAKTVATKRDAELLRRLKADLNENSRL